MIVYEEGDRRRLAVATFNYSLFSSNPEDLFLDRYWGILTKGIKARKPEVRRALILGLGGGTFVFLLNHYFSPEIIEGVEIDPEIMDIGKRYFYLSLFPNLNSYLADAMDWVSLMRRERKDFFDLIIFDLYKAVQLPENCETLDFLRSTFNLLTPDGMAVFNRVCDKAHKREVLEDFKKEKLNPFFTDIREDVIKGVLGFNNYIIYAQHKKGVLS